ncbi:MAG: branched-chain amino acid ABC transporter permease [Desulfobacterales bacterium]|nr:branched-chain amino acid ABC transporter permease [Desulfobacterales bacterium]
MKQGSEMGNGEFKKFIIYSLFLGVLILPMVGFPGTHFEAKRAFIVWGVFVGVLALGMLNQVVRQSSIYQKTLGGPQSFNRRVTKQFQKIPVRHWTLILLAAVAVYPLLANNYMVDVGITCLIYIVLGLGLNIVVGLAGLLDLGYIAFYAVGAYTYSLLNLHFGMSFWLCLPIGILLGAILGCVIGYPTLRMRGDYLAIVTMGFGEIIRLVLNNWDSLTKGPNGLLGMAKPSIMYPAFSNSGLEWATYSLKSLHALYYFILLIAVLTVIGVRRLDQSRIGRAWVAIREDEVAAELSGVPTTWLKLLAYAMGAAFASVAGAFFAAKLSYTNPNFFIFMESCIVLCIVVLGGAGSIPGVILAGVLLIAVPEVFRELQDYRMFAFGLAMAVMMVLRPEGLIPATRRKLGLSDIETDTIGELEESYQAVDSRT